MLSPLGSEPRAWVRKALARYWSHGEELIAALPVPRAVSAPEEPLPPRLAAVELPDWAADIAVDGCLVVPVFAVGAGSGPAFLRTDWWAAAEWFLDGTAEREYERRHGSIHSYCFRLAGWDARMWDHAWVNRIALFLRRAAARHADRDEVVAFGARPEPEILLTHDVDAVRKTLRIRLKQGVFSAFNAARAAGRGRLAVAAQRLAHAGRFVAMAGDYWTIDRVCGMESRRGLRSIFHVYAGAASDRSLAARTLFDPSYDFRDLPLAAAWRRLAADGWTIGLHQSFDAWRTADPMRRQKAMLEATLGAPIEDCRQHWLRFSWADTWAAQEAAGFTLDTTLGFNDRPGFRNGGAIRIHPRDAGGNTLRLSTIPMVLMDSHLYDYARPSASDPAAGIARWIDEIVAVGGTASVLWHPHVLSADYGWADGFEELLNAIA